MTSSTASMPSNAVPNSVALANAKLTLSWDGMQSTMDASTLRAACRCAQCRFERHKRGIADDSALPVSGNDHMAISEVSSMGYGLQIRFSDGHDRGIFPWAYLRELAINATT